MDSCFVIRGRDPPVAQLLDIMRITGLQSPLVSSELSPMSDSTASIRGQRPVPLIQRRQGKSSAQDMGLDHVPQPNSLGLHYPSALPKLETVSPEMELPQQRQKKKKRGPKSTCDLEIQELKGFMELGFDFSQDKLSPRLLDLLPGLKRLLIGRNFKKEIEFRESPLENWELPTLNATGVDLKEHLKLWARSVASSLKC